MSLRELVRANHGGTENTELNLHDNALMRISISFHVRATALTFALIQISFSVFSVPPWFNHLFNTSRILRQEPFPVLIDDVVNDLIGDLRKVRSFHDIVHFVLPGDDLSGRR